MFRNVHKGTHINFRLGGPATIVLLPVWLLCRMSNRAVKLEGNEIVHHWVVYGG